MTDEPDQTQGSPAPDMRLLKTDPSPDDGLRLLRAFKAIRDPAGRDSVIRFAEQLASGTLNG